MYTQNQKNAPETRILRGITKHFKVILGEVKLESPEFKTIIKSDSSNNFIIAKVIYRGLYRRYPGFTGGEKVHSIMV